MTTMPARMILPLIFGMLVLPVFPQDEPPTAGATKGVPDHIADLIRKAEEGNVDAQFDLARMYLMGEAIPLDYKEAFRWYRASAVQGNSRAQGSLGAMYQKGLGLPQDYIQAHMWYNLAIANSELDKEKELWVKNRDFIAEKMTAEQIAEAQRLVREWKPKTGGQ